MRTRLAVWLAVMAMLFVAGCGSGQVEQTGDSGGGAGFYEGKTLHFVVSFGAGGGYDIIARAIAPYLEEELGATVVVENKEGAGGLLAANEIYTGKPDGLTMGFFSGQGIAGATLGGAEGVRFDLKKFSYVSRLAAGPRALTVGGDNSEYKTIQDVRTKKGFRFGSTGPGGSDHIDATVLFPVLGIDGKIITGFDGSSSTELAVTSGDVDGSSGTVSSRFSAIESGDHRAVLAIAEKPVEKLPGVPTLLELDLDKESRSLAEAHLSLQKMGRMVWAPPGVPKERLAALEDAFAAATKNEDFLAKMKKADQPVNFLRGKDAKAVADDVLSAPPRYRALLAKAFKGQ